MSTRSIHEFVDNGRPIATVYRHWDGYPSVAGADIVGFFDAVEEQTADTRFSDPSYLAAKYVVYLAGKFAESDAEPLAFLSVGIIPTGARDWGEEYVYLIDTSRPDDRGRPTVTVSAYSRLPIPLADALADALAEEAAE